MAKVITDEIKIQELLTRSVEKIFPSRDFLEQRLRSGEKLSVYLGVDPTGPELHLGHSVQLFVLKRFQALGHKIIIVIGDFTAQIGDPTGKDLTRKSLAEKEVRENAQRYKNQIAKILDIGRADFKYNSSWLGRLNFKDVVRLGAFKTVQQLLDRDMFQRRIAKGESIGIHEFLYPLMQGYDSVAMKIDGEIGGSDQTFNMLVGRDLEKDYLGKEKFVLTTHLLVNPRTGKKMMSKSEGDYVSLEDDSQNMYAKVLALPDESTFDFFELCTEVPLERINHLKSGDILAAKHELAFEITKIYHDQEMAEESAKEFERVFSKKEKPTEMPEFSASGSSLLDFMVKSGLVKSKSEAKQLFDQGAVRINNEIAKIKTNWNYELREGDIIQVGPRKFVKIKR